MSYGGRKTSPLSHGKLSAEGTAYCADYMYIYCGSLDLVTLKIEYHFSLLDLYQNRNNVFPGYHR